MLWSENAKNCPYVQGDILTVHGAKVAYFGSCRHLSAISGTMILKNDNTSRVQKLRDLMHHKEESNNSDNEDSS